MVCCARWAHESSVRRPGVRQLPRDVDLIAERLLAAHGVQVLRVILPLGSQILLVSRPGARVHLLAAGAALGADRRILMAAEARAQHPLKAAEERRVGQHADERSCVLPRFQLEQPLHIRPVGAGKYLFKNEWVMDWYFVADL